MRDDSFWKLWPFEELIFNQISYFIYSFVHFFFSSISRLKLKFNEDVRSQLIEFVTRWTKAICSRNIFLSFFFFFYTLEVEIEYKKRKKKSLSYIRNTSRNDQFFVHTFRIKKIETEPTEHYLRNSILL